MKKAQTKTGDRFIQARKIIGLSQTKIANELGKTPATIRNWEHDRAKCNDYKDLAFYASKSGLSIDYLMGITDDQHGSAVLEYYAKRVEQAYRMIDYLNNISPYSFKLTETSIPVFVIYEKETNKRIRKLTRIELLDFCKSLNEMIMIATDSMIKLGGSRIAEGVLNTQAQEYQYKKQEKDFYDETISDFFHVAAVKNIKDHE